MACRLIRSAPRRAFASWIAARSVHTGAGPAVAHMPSPGFASMASVVLFTLKVAARVEPARAIELSRTRYSARRRVLITVAAPRPTPDCQWRPGYES